MVVPYPRPWLLFFKGLVGAWDQSNIDTYTMRRGVISLGETLLPVFLSWKQNLEYLCFIGIGQNHLWAQKMKWWHWLKIISWEGHMFLVQPSSLYYFYFPVYDFIILTSTHTYIKPTICGHRQFLLLHVKQNIFTSLILPDIPGQARTTLPTLQ